MKCPHCLVEINENFTFNFIGSDKDGNFSVSKMNCPNPKCNKLIVRLSQGEKQYNGILQGNVNTVYVRPLVS